MEAFLHATEEYQRLGIAEQIDYQKFYLYSIITHSTAIEGSTVTEVENQLLFDEGLSAKGRTMVEQLMNIDLKAAYEHSMSLAEEHTPFSIPMLKELSALVMKNTGSKYSTLMGDFDSSQGDLRLVNVTAGAGGQSYMNYMKVPSRLQNFCDQMNDRRKALSSHHDLMEEYLLSFDAHNVLVAIHPWVDGNGRMSRLVMNHIQYEFGLVPTKVMQEDKAEYIQALIASRKEESMEPFRLFMVKEHTRNFIQEIDAYKKSISEDATPKVDKKGGQETTEVDKKPMPRGVATRQKILVLISSNNRITTTEMASRLGINRSALSKHLKVMQKAGVIRHEGSTKSGCWVVTNNDGRH